MFFESIFMIRGGAFGEDFTGKLIWSIIALIACFYDWKMKGKRLDYFWVFLIGTLIWSTTELILQLIGTRVMQRKFLFGFEITSWLWLTIPLQGISEGALPALIALFFGDRIMNEETRKRWIIIFIIFMVLAQLPSGIYFYGIHFNDVNVGGDVPSRRNMFTLMAIIYLSILIAPAIYWIITTDSEPRKRGIYMFILLLINTIYWTFWQCITGQRWIEVGIVNADGTFSNLRRAPPLIEFTALAYDVVIEIVLAYMPFLAIPYLLKLIKSEEIKENTKII